MNWKVFFLVLLVTPVGWALVFGLIEACIWMDSILGRPWGGVIGMLALLVATASLIGWRASE